MTSKERIETVIAGGIPDRVPATVHQWQSYHLRNVMGVAADIEAFHAVGLDAVVYPWGCVKSCKSPDWVVTSTETPHDDRMTGIETRVITPGGVLLEKAMRTDYTTSTIEYLVKRPEDIRLIRQFMPVPQLDVDAVAALRTRLGAGGILRCFTNGPQGSPWQDACCFCGTEEMIYRAHDDPQWTHDFLEILLQKKMEFYRTNLAPLAGVFSMIETGGGAASNTKNNIQVICVPSSGLLRAVLAGTPGQRIGRHTDRPATAFQHPCMPKKVSSTCFLVREVAGLSSYKERSFEQLIVSERSALL